MKKHTIAEVLAKNMTAETATRIVVFLIYIECSFIGMIWRETTAIGVEHDWFRKMAFLVWAWSPIFSVKLDVAKELCVLLLVA